MPIHKEVTEHAFYTEGPSLTEPEHAERCSIEHQLLRISRGLPPNWGNQDVQYGYEKMDNSLTDHKIALEKAAEDALKSDLTEISDEDFASLNPTTQKILANERQRQIQAKAQKEKHDRTQKTKHAKENDEINDEISREKYDRVQRENATLKRSADGTPTDEKPPVGKKPSP